MAMSRGREVMFYSALALIRHWPGKFSLYWQIPGEGTWDYPFYSEDNPYVPYGESASFADYDAARIRPDAKLNLWFYQSNGTSLLLFECQLPAKSEYDEYLEATAVLRGMP